MAWSVPITYQGKQYTINLDTSNTEGAVPIVVGGITYYTRTIPAGPVLPKQDESPVQQSSNRANTSSSSLVTATTSSSSTSAASAVKAMKLSSNNAIAREEAKEDAIEKANQDAERNKTKTLLFFIIKTAQEVLKKASDSKNSGTMRNDIIGTVTISNEADDIKQAKTDMKSALEKLRNINDNALALTKTNIENYVTTLMTCMVAIAGWKADPYTDDFKSGKNTARAALKAMNGALLTDLQSFDIAVNEQYTPPPGHKAAFITPVQRMLQSMSTMLQSLNGKTTIQEFMDAIKTSFEAQTGKTYYDLLNPKGGRQTRRARRKRALRKRHTRKHFRKA